MNKYLLGIDNGGTMSKVALYDIEGNEIAVSSGKCEMIMPKPGYTERNLNELWEVNVDNIKNVMEMTEIDPANIEGISVTGYGNGIHMIDKNGNPSYNGIVSTDTRAKGYVKKWYKDGTIDKVLPKTMQSIWPGQIIPLLAWFKDNKPDVLDNTEWVFSVTDYIRYCLTGEAYAEITNISGSNALNVRDVNYDTELLKDFGVERYERLFPPVKYSSDICGYITKEVAKITGLKVGTPVAGGLFDIDACAIATGITDNRQLCIIAGTWSINQYISDKPVIDKDIFMTSLYCMKGYWLVMEGSTTSASNLEWFVQQFLNEEKRIAKEQGQSVYAACDKMVEKTKPEDSSIIFLPFLFGSNFDADAKSCFIGLNGWNKKEHILRAIYEGIVFSHFHHLEKLFKHREKPKSIRISGGASRSRVWVQIFADILQIPIEVTEGSELGTLGAVMCSGVATGIYDSFKEAAQKMIKVSYICTPNKKNKDLYMKKYRNFKDIIDRLSAEWKKL